ncbi:MAG: T9SS type A sorting domain-containing protein [Winogradskyella sp.]|nr:MAG: T9SS type A sorting domain-containing protein [Winogradskyella sp.]
MKKKLLSVSFFLFTALLYAQIPTYYNDVNLNQTGTSLKDELSSKITTTQTTILSYTPSVWNALQQSDLDPTDTSKVLLIYGYDDNDGEFKTDRSRGVNNNGGGVGLWNREHVYPRSLGNPNLGSTGPGSDAHSLRPSDGQMNSSRSNRKFASGNGNSVITPQGNFYPGDEWKGDVARMMMYMYLRYGSRCLPSNVAVGNTVAGDANMIDILLQWNADDPVNGFEDNRNEVIAGIQGNRNPFVDNPAFATQIWGGPQAEDRFGMGVVDTEAPTVPLNLVASNTTSNSTVLNWTASTDDIGVTGYNVFQDGAFVVTVSSTTYNVSGLGASTGYSFSVNAIDAAGNASANSASAVVTTQSAGTGGTASELFISEYIEGSSNNKALEIANFTGSTVSLSGYSLRKATNGSGSFTSTYNLTGQLANGEVFVVANSSATSVILNEADATSGVTTFNGNDAIGLFKDNVIIDLMGDANSSANFAKDVTLRRKSSVLDPNTTYTVSEWDQFPQNTFDDLGSHTVDGGGPAPDTEAPSAPTNVVASNVTTNSATLSWSASTDNVGVTGYDVYQGSTLLASVTTTGYTVTGLSPSTNYTFNVRAKDAANNVSNASSNVGVTTATPPDTQAPSAPTNVVASNVTTNSATLSWSASTDNVGVTGYDIYQGSTLLASVTTTGYTVTGLSPSTNYMFNVRAKDAANNVSNASSSVSVTTDTVVLNYCNSQGNNTNYEFIDFVGLGGISNGTSANGGYGDFTNQTANISYGSNTIVVSAGFPGQSYTEQWRAWIDFNQNGTFESSEEIVSGSSSSSGNLSYNFTVPNSALIGNTRLRVSMKWNGTPGACETFTYGEVEDYTVNIGNTSARFAPLANITIDGELGEEQSVFKSTIQNTYNGLGFEMKDDRQVSYTVYNMSGRFIAKGKFSRKTKLSNLNAGIYIVHINDGQRTIQKKVIVK